MSDVGDWLEANARALEELACTSALDVRIVQLIAVLAYAGLSDEEIESQLVIVAIAANVDREPLLEAPRALERIRRLVPVA